MRIIQVKVKPNARVSKLEEMEDGTWVAHVHAIPVDGKANAELIASVAKHFGVRRNAVSIKTGGSGRMKLVEIDE